jgi:hypothetical protein
MSVMAIATDLWCSSECTPPCQGGGRGFKSRQVRHRAPTRLRAVGARLPGRVAQLVERAPEKREVTGSTPVPTTGDPRPGAHPGSDRLLGAKFRALRGYSRTQYEIRIRLSRSQRSTRQSGSSDFSGESPRPEVPLN